MNHYEVFEFQSLIGTLKTPFSRPFLFASLVSIPNRDAKNKNATLAALRILKFQSLIGTLKTSLCNLSTLVPATVSIPNRDAKNQSSRDQKRIRKRVSIPNRDAKNAKSSLFRALFLCSFNP